MLLTLAHDAQAPCFNNPAFSELVCFFLRSMLINKPDSRLFHGAQYQCQYHCALPVASRWL